MIEHYRKLLAAETEYLTSRIAKYNKILERDEIDSATDDNNCATDKSPTAALLNETGKLLHLIVAH